MASRAPVILSVERFEREYEFLSNFYRHSITYGNWHCKSVEHGYQASKTFDVEQQRAILGAPSPKAAKRLGRQTILRPDWEQVKETVMAELLAIKFANPGLRSKLLGTGNAELIEGNWWGDTYWGRCDGVGQNRLGILLMELRAELAGKTQQVCSNCHQALFGPSGVYCRLFQEDIANEAVAEDCEAFERTVS